MSNSNNPLKRHVLACAASLIAATTFSVAASAQKVPTSVEPGQIQKTLPSPTKQNLPGLTPKSRTTSKPDSMAPNGSRDISFVLKELSVEGSSVYKSREFLRSVEDKVGQEISVSELFDIASTLTARYRNDGYLLSTVIVPPQKIDSGKVTLKAVEGYLDRIVVEGVTAKQKRKILRYLNKVVGQRPLKSKNLERYLLLVDDLSGVKLKTFMQPSTENGGAATLTVKPQIERFNVWSSADSRGTEFVGPYNLALGGTLHAPNVLGQSISGQVATTPPNTEELQYVSLSFAQEVGYEGTSVTVSASGMRSEPGQELRQLELESEALNFDMAIRLKPYRSRDANVYISLAGSIKEAETKALDSVLSQDRARQVKFGLDFQGIDNFLGANSFSFAASQGIDAMGSTPEGSALQSRFDADPEATWFNVGFTRVQSLAKWRPGFDLKASVAAQYAFEPLSAAREFSIGGMANASAFDSSEINGDNGLSGRLEVRYATSLGAIDRGVSEGWRGFAVQAYAFGDGGQVWQTRVGDQERDNGQTDDMIASAGAGLRFNLGPYTSATVEVAKPFLNVVASEGNKDPRVFFSFTNRF